MLRRLLAVVGCAALAGATLLGGTAAAAPATPTTSPITGGKGVPTLASTVTYDLGQSGYTTSEFSFSGTATSYTSAAPLTADGRWDVQPATTAAYTSRAVVYRPARDRDFNGTVVVEWLNVSGQVDAAPEFALTHVELLRRGYAYVAVSAQAIGLNATKTADPQRYAALNHPGDSYSYDIFSQAGQVLKSNPAAFLGSLRPQRVIAAGESQSAGRLLTYIDGVHPLARVYDGFLVHSRSASVPPLSQAPQAVVPAPSNTIFRTDIPTPVLNFQSETDTGGLPARQPDTNSFRLWEATGTAHFDAYGLDTALRDDGDQQYVTEYFNAMRTPPTPPGFGCNQPINTGPSTYLLRAAIAGLNTWVTTGQPPTSAPRFVLSAPGSSYPYAVDSNGITLGGIRTPHVDAPVAQLRGLGQPLDQGFCRLFGTTKPFDSQQLFALYRNHGAFVTAWNASTRAAEGAGFLLREDASALTRVAAQASIPT